MARRVLITGAGGKIGSLLRERLRGVYPVLRLSHRRAFGAATDNEEIVLANLDRFDEVVALTEGVDAIVHMGGKGVEGDWDTVLQSNIIGTYNLFEAARINGVKRVVFASTNHVVGYYRRDQRVGPNDPVRPDSRYGVSKVFGEALGRMYADKYGLSVICQRIGCFFSEPKDRRHLAEWISFDDMVELTRCCIDARDIHFEIVYGVSANDRCWWDNPTAEKIGYRPKDNAEDFAEAICSATPAAAEPAVEREFQGGWFTGMEFVGDPDRIN